MHPSSVKPSQIFRDQLKRLEEAIPLSFCKPLQGTMGWKTEREMRMIEREVD